MDYRIFPLAIIPFQALTCPLDGTLLQRQDNHWCCVNGHHFDIARQGHTHLLPVQNKRSREPGDSKAMVAARQRFLDSGSYAPIAAAVSRLTLTELADHASCLDAGCGEGYYLRQLAAAVPETQQLAVLGLDISKWAVQAAARQDKQAAWVVGSNANLPVPTASVDRLLCLFGFPVHSEFARVLKPGGWLLQVDAGPDHLRELREILYPRLNEKAEPCPRAESFRLHTSEALSYPLWLNTPQLIADLLAMTPHLYRTPAAGRARAAALTELQLTVDVRLNLLVRE